MKVNWNSTKLALLGKHYYAQVFKRNFDAERFVQGFSPKKGVREYFYYIDHQGQVFLDGTKVRNFVTCFKDKDFLVFFMKKLRYNNQGKYESNYPFVSRCGPEMNYIRCENKPIVFTDVIEFDTGYNLIVNNIGERMTYPFQPHKLCMLPRNGRVYHPAFPRLGGVGILKTNLAMQFSSCFRFKPNSSETEPPTHFVWQNIKYKLDNELWELMREENIEEKT